MALRCLPILSVLAGATLAAGVAIAAENAAPSAAPAPDQAGQQGAAPAAGAAAPSGQAAQGQQGQQGAAPAGGAAGGQAAQQGDKAGGAAASGGGGGGSPKATAEKAEKGSLKSSISDPKQAAGEGQKIFTAAGCNGCHGGSGGGGMGPPLTNQVWVYGSDDDTLFRLIALGSDALQKQGYSRKGSESVVGPMPPMGEIVKSDEDLWKVIAWIRSINPSSGGTPPATAAK